jgi:CHRD domain
MAKFRKLLIICAATGTLALGACTSAPVAQTAASSSAVAMSSRLSGANEVPANTSAGSGTLEASFDKQTSMLTWTVTYSGLTGPVKAGHFHGPALAGANSGVALGFTGSMDSPIKGSATLTPAQAADVMAGKWYVNLHTAAFAGGEIRGQLAAK